MDGKLVGEEDPGNWMDCLKDDFQAFGATVDGSTVDNRLTFGVDRAVWTLAAKMDNGAPWHKGVLKRPEKFMTAWHKEEEASRRRATKRDFCSGARASDHTLTPLLYFLAGDQTLTP